MPGVSSFAFLAIFLATSVNIEFLRKLQARNEKKKGDNCSIF